MREKVSPAITKVAMKKTSFYRLLKNKIQICYKWKTLLEVLIDVGHKLILRLLFYFTINLGIQEIINFILK